MTATAHRAAGPTPSGSPSSIDLARLGERGPALRPFLLTGALAIVTGGVVAAISRPTGFEVGPWLAAYLVLVAGVAQIAVGVGWAWLPSVAPDRRATTVEVVLWHLGVAGTIVGTLVEAPGLTTAAGIVVVVALVRALHRTWRWDRSATPVWLARAYLALVALVAVSTPVGSLLAWVRHG